MRRTTESYSIHLFGMLSGICFYSTMKKRTQVRQIDDRTWVVYSRKSQGYGRKQPVFQRRISLDTIQVFPGSIRSTTNSSYDDTGFRWSSMRSIDSTYYFFLLLSLVDLKRQILQKRET